MLYALAMSMIAASVTMQSVAARWQGRSAGNRHASGGCL